LPEHKISRRGQGQHLRLEKKEARKGNGEMDRMWYFLKIMII
jgi:hypothetical protein